MLGLLNFILVKGLKVDLAVRIVKYEIYSLSYPFTI